MLSVIMPYWNRRKLLHKTLEQWGDWYGGLPMEVIIVDDGSEEDPGIDPFKPGFGFSVRVLSLSKKNHAKNPCVPINRGVEAARGDVIVITNPENTHRTPIFPQMFVQLQELGEKGYVLAACWNGEHWLCHSTKKHPNAHSIPPGGGLHFCAMMYRGFFNEIGGFDEGYREGSGYDDNDWIWLVHKHGGEMRVRDDLVVEHVRTKTGWSGAGFTRNRKRFEQRWTPYWNQL